MRYYFLAFSFKERSQFHEIMYQDKLLKLGARLRVYNSPPMAASFTELISQLESYNEYSALKFELLVKVLCINVTQVFSNIHTQHYTSPLIDSEQTLYYRIINYIDHNLTKIDRLSDIAANSTTITCTFRACSKKNSGNPSIRIFPIKNWISPNS